MLSPTPTPTACLAPVGDRARLDDAFLPAAFDASAHRGAAFAIDNHQERVDAGHVYRRRLIGEVAIEHAPVLAGARVRFGQDLSRRELDDFFRRDPDGDGRITDPGHLFLTSAQAASLRFAAEAG
jgi:hypothetical protein